MYPVQQPFSCEAPMRWQNAKVVAVGLPTTAVAEAVVR